MKSKPENRSKYYFIFLLIILIILQNLDSYSASYTQSFPSKIIEEFLAGYNQNDADSIMQLSIGIATLGMLFVFISQAVSDRWGRKIMLVVTTFGMGLAALLLYFSIDIISYTFFLTFTYMFVSSDIWLIYITEEAPPKKRGFYTNLVMALGILGPILITVFRMIFITETSPVGSWRGLTYFPIVIGIPLGLIMIFTVKETSKFELLKMEPANIRMLNKSGKFREDMKLIFKSKRKMEIWILVIMSFTLGLNYLLLQMAESYAKNSTSLSEDDVSLIIMIIAVAIIAMYFVIAFFSDRFGRKSLLYVFSIMLPVGVIILYLAGQLGTNEFLLATLGMTLGYMGHNGLQILLRIIIIEVLPTERRGTGSGFRAFIQSAGITIGFFLGSLLTRYVGLGLTFVIFAIPVIINLPLIWKFVKETKGVDLSSVEGN